MAEIPHDTIYQPDKTVGGNDTLLVIWRNMAQGDVGQTAQLPSWADCSFQAVGVFGAAGAAAINGSNDGVSFGLLNDPFGVPLSLGDVKPRQATERCEHVRPQITGGDVTTSISVWALFRRQPL